MRRRGFAGRADAVAPSLLGQVLVRRLGNVETRGRIVEVEAYLGVADDCCHTWGGRRTPRNESMWHGAGTAYVYRIYGVHWCFNVVTGRMNEGAAVLVRALEPLEGLPVMRHRRNGVADRLLCNGPGRLCQALAIDGRLDDADLRASQALWIEPGPAPGSIVRSSRIGMRASSRRATARLRYCSADSRGCSRPPTGVRRRR